MSDIQRALVYSDEYPLLRERKALLILCERISDGAMSTIKSPVFEMVTLVVIVWNSIMLALDDPTTNVQPAYQDDLDLMFLILYTVEMSLKIVAMVEFALHY